MKKGMNVSQATLPAAEYLVPEFKVRNVCVRKVLCLSTQQVDFGEEQNDGPDGDFE